MNLLEKNTGREVKKRGEKKRYVGKIERQKTRAGGEGDSPNKRQDEVEDRRNGTCQEWNPRNP